MGTRTPLDVALWEQRRTNRWLARRLDVHETQVSRWRNGLHVPGDDTRQKIARALDRDVHELWPPDKPQVAA